jgi:hypothetical protein
MTNNIVSTVIGIGTLYGAGATHFVLGSRKVKNATKPLKQRSEEIHRLQNVFTFTQKQTSSLQNQLQPHPEEREQVLVQSSDSFRNIGLDQENREISSISREESSLPSSETILIDEVESEKERAPKWLRSLKKGKSIQTERMSPAQKVEYGLALTIFGDVFGTRLKQEKTLQTIDKLNRISASSQILAGAGQIASATALLGEASSAIANAALGFSLVSSLFFLGASLYGVYFYSRELSKNAEKQQTLLERKKELTGQTFDGTSSSEKTTMNAFVLSELANIESQLTILKNEEALFKQSRNFHLFKTLAATMSITATVLVLVGTQGIGFGAVCAYYGLVAMGGSLPFVAMAYRHFSANEKRYLIALSKVLHQKIPPLPNLSSIQNQHALEWILKMLKKNFESFQRGTTKEVAWIQEFLEQIDRMNLIETLQELHEIALKEEIYSRKYANGIQELRFQ